jgi:hypothetical protein
MRTRVYVALMAEWTRRHGYGVHLRDRSPVRLTQCFHPVVPVSLPHLTGASATVSASPLQADRCGADNGLGKA